MARDRLIDQVLRTIRRHRMLQAGDRVLIAVSGGPDSMALLHLLAALQHEMGYVPGVAHFDHRIRPDSQFDLEFVRQGAAALDLPFFSGECDVPRLVEMSGGNLEQVARLQRRAFLEKVCMEENFHKVATGHTVDDQAETVLMNLLRGSGSTGLGGIAPKRGKWIRPLLEVRHTDILEFLARLQADFRADPTNLDTRFLRNRIRRRMLPLLQKEYSCNIVRQLSTLADIQREAARHWRRSCRRWIESDSTGRLVRAECLRARSVAEQRETLRLFLSLERGSLRRITFEQVESIRGLAARDGAGKRVTLPGGWEARNRRGILRVGRVAQRAGE